MAGVGFSSTAPDQLSGSIHPLCKAIGHFPVTDQWNLQWNLAGRTLLGGFLSNEHVSVSLGAPKANVYPPLYPASHTAIIISGMQSNHLLFVRKAAGLKATELLLDAVCNNLRQAVFLVGLLQSFYCNAEKNTWICYYDNRCEMKRADFLVSLGNHGKAKNFVLEENKQAEEEEKFQITTF